jgi:hypothetical protein
MSINKYDKFIIYCISPKDDPSSKYIGSTISFNRRKHQHKKNTTNKSNKKYHCPLYQYIRALGGWEFFNMEVLEHYPCKNKVEGLTREKELIIEHKSKLNVNKPIKDSKSLSDI